MQQYIQQVNFDICIIQGDSYIFALFPSWEQAQNRGSARKRNKWVQASNAALCLWRQALTILYCCSEQLLNHNLILPRQPKAVSQLPVAHLELGVSAAGAGAGWTRRALPLTTCSVSTSALPGRGDSNWQPLVHQKAQTTQTLLKIPLLQSRACAASPARSYFSGNWG